MFAIPDITRPDKIIKTYPTTAAMHMVSNNRMNASEQKPFKLSPIISFITAEVPDLPLPVMDNVTSDKTDVTVPIDATMDMNAPGLFSFFILADSAAPAVAVMPGNHPAIEPVTTPLSPGTGA